MRQHGGFGRNRGATDPPDMSEDIAIPQHPDTGTLHPAAPEARLGTSHGRTTMPIPNPAPTPTRILMCPPTHFTVDYVINPWMEGQIDRVDPLRAQAQWQALRAILAGLAGIDEIEQARDLPDMPFTANAGLVHGQRFVPSRFRHIQREGEAPLFTAWFHARGYEILELPPGVTFEGAGDALFDRGNGGLLWAGYGHRSDAGVPAQLGHLLDVDTVALRLADPRFYHLDTCLCPLTGGWLLYHPGAFDEQGRAAIERHVPAAKRIAVEAADAEAFACNAVNVGDAVVLNRASAALRERLQQAGFRVIETPLDEFLKAGGSAKCLTLRLDD